MPTDNPLDEQGRESAFPSQIPPSVIEEAAQKADVAPATVREIVSVVEERLHIEERRHSGPLPPPETLGSYEQVCEGSARLILDMAVRAQLHAHEMQKLTLTSEVKYRNLGISVAAGILALMISGSVFCAYVNNTGAAIALGAAAGLTGVAGVFVRGRDLSEKLPGDEAGDSADPDDVRSGNAERPKVQERGGT